MAAPAQASYSQIIAFGDSLTDTGNLHYLTSFLPNGGIPAAPYYQGRFSNGLLAVESMGYGLGLNITSYAYAGAETGLDNQGSTFLYGTGVTGQVRNFGNTLLGQPADAAALYFVWAGANDFYVGDNMLSTATATTAVQNTLGNIKTLFDDGAKDFFVPLMPDLSRTPAALLNTEAYQAAAALRTQEYNTQLLAALNALSAATPGLNITTFDTVSFMSQTTAELQAAGFDVTDACYNTTTQTICSTPEQYLFWDQLHPSAAGHWILGQAFASTVLTASIAASTTVPEPSVNVLALLGLIVMGWHLQRTNARRSA